MGPVIQTIRPKDERRVRFKDEPPRPSTAPPAPRFTQPQRQQAPNPPQLPLRPQHQPAYMPIHANDSGFFQGVTQSRHAYYPSRGSQGQPIYVARSPPSSLRRLQDPIYFEGRPKRHSFSELPRPRVIYPEPRRGALGHGTQADSTEQRRYHTIEIVPTRQRSERAFDSERLARLNAQLEKVQEELRQARTKLAQERYLRQLTDDVWKLRTERDLLRDRQQAHQEFVASRADRMANESRRVVSIHHGPTSGSRQPTAPEAPRPTYSYRPARESRTRESPPNVSQRVWSKVEELEERLRRGETAKSLRRPI